jgi:hypothetical protein
MTTKTKVTRARKTIDQRLQDMRARLEGLEKRKNEQEKRDLYRLKLRIGGAAVAAGFTADWTDAQLDRAMATAIRTRDGLGKVPMPKAEAEPAKGPATVLAAPASKSATPTC